MSVSDEIKERIDVIEFIGRYTPLKKAGTTYKGLCPFHSERTPSFIVFPHTGTWHCFGSCGTGGDIFSFVMRKENLDFREALQLLAREAGVELDEGPAANGSSRRDQLYEVNTAAADYFRHILATHPAAEPARAYLNRRGIDDDTRTTFALGYSLDEWSGLRDHLLARKFPLDLLLEAGLIKRNEARESTYDAFRGRVMIPIRDRLGRVIGFGGRVLDGSQPKYLNTAETPVFHKSHVVYGLDQAHTQIRDAGKVVIVEGYMDVIAAHQFGFTNVVACMGTALTPDQLQQLQRYTSNFVLALDADAAGQQATIRGLNQARQALSRVRRPTPTPGGMRFEERLGAALFIVAMSDGRDPDDVVRADPDLWRTLVDQAKPLVDFYFSVVAREADLTTAQGKGAAVAELAPLIAELDDAIEREHYIQQLSRLVQLDERMIAGRVQAVARTGQAAAGRPRSQAARPGRGPTRRRPTDTPPEPPPDDDYAYPPELPPVVATPVKQGLATEEYLLANLLRDPDLLIWLANAVIEREIAPVDSQDWQHTEHQEIFRALRRLLSSDVQWDLESFQESLPGALHGRLAHLVATGADLPPCDRDELRIDLLKVLIRIRLNLRQEHSIRLKYLEDEAKQSGGERDDNLGAQHNQVLRDIAHLQQVLGQLSMVLASQQRAGQGLLIR